MKRSFLVVGLMLFMGLALSAATTLKVTTAQEVGGVAVVVGKAGPGAAIYWEGTKVTTAVKDGLLAGYFAFSGTLPGNCKGTLSDGTTSLTVLVNTFNPARECNGLALVPRTGQTLSNHINDDGDWQSGVVLPTPRFSDQGNGTVRDNLTGLIWLKNADCGLTSSNGQSGAFAFVDELNRTGTMASQPCGDTSKAGTHQTDWRLPNIRELGSLINYGYSQPAISNAAGTAKGSDQDPFTNFRGALDGSAGYWSSTSLAGSSDIAWGANFGLIPPDSNGFVYLMNTGHTTGFGGYVIAVRGGVLD